MSFSVRDTLEEVVIISKFSDHPYQLFLSTDRDSVGDVDDSDEVVGLTFSGEFVSIPNVNYKLFNKKRDMFLRHYSNGKILKS